MSNMVTIETQASQAPLGGPIQTAAKPAAPTQK